MYLGSWWEMENPQQEIHKLPLGLFSKINSLHPLPLAAECI